MHGFIDPEWKEIEKEELSVAYWKTSALELS